MLEHAPAACLRLMSIPLLSCLPLKVLDGQYSTDVISDKADAYIRQAAANQTSADVSQRKPFYLQVRYHVLLAARVTLHRLGSFTLHLERLEAWLAWVSDVARP